MTSKHFFRFALSITLLAMLTASCHPHIEGSGFDEPENPNPVPEGAWDHVNGGLNAAYGSIDHRYEHDIPPSHGPVDPWSLTAWRGERVHAQMVLWSADEIQNIRVSATPLRGEAGRISQEQISIHPVRYVITDIFLRGCGWRDGDTIPSSLAADLLEDNQAFQVLERTTRPVWISIDVPSDAEPGLYSGEIRVSARGERRISLPYEIEVLPHELPPANEWAFHLDLWQNPFAIARYYEVEPWSEEHWELLPPYLEMLADAGQKNLTASILHRPWGGQTYDHFESKVEWRHLGNGQWEYDYSVFDRWVELGTRSGITGPISSYSMVPWGNQVRYYDADSTDYVTVRVIPGTEEYEAIWTPFLRAFRDHVTERGWIDRTLIAMDERGLEEMSAMVELLKRVAPELKIGLAGNFYEELTDDIYDLCVFHRPVLDQEHIRRRQEQGLITTFYTMCAAPEHPNNFTFSPPAEQAFLGWYAAAHGYDGFLRWAYNSWVADPVRDSRFRTWPAGDTYQIYPGPRSSIRFERLREGIQDFEKIRILRALMQQQGHTAGLNRLATTLEPVTMANVTEPSAAHWVNQGKQTLDELSRSVQP